MRIRKKTVQITNSLGIFGHVTLENEIAHRRRKCHTCKSTILKGEAHFVNYRKKPNLMYKIRTNTCCHCAVEEMMSIRDSYADAIKITEAYLEKHPGIKYRKLLLQLKEGTLKKEDSCT